MATFFGIMGRLTFHPALNLDPIEPEGTLARFRSVYPLVISEGQVPAVRAALRRALTIASM